MNGLAHDNDAFREITSLLNNYKSDPDKWKYIYTYDTHKMKWYYMDGQPKIPDVKRK